ncbi:hypothetical protein BGZ98_002352, partial [Dissophora globulifera]
MAMRLSRPWFSTLLLLTLHASISHALSCTYPSYNTQVQPGQDITLSWALTPTDISTYDSLTATLYCMDIDGNEGGMWRTIATLFQNRALGYSTQSQYTFTTPYCGPLARDVAIRIVATGKTATLNDACYFAMNPIPITNPVPPPVVTTQAPPTTTLAPPVSNTLFSKTASLSATSSLSISTGAQTATISGTTSAVFPNPSGRPYPPLPPLPSVSDSPTGSSSGNSTGPGDSGSSGPNRVKTIAASIGGVGAGVALVVVMTIIILRRRRSAQQIGRRVLSGSGGYDWRRGMTEKLAKQGRRLKGLGKKGREHDFFLMQDDDDYNDYYNKEKYDEDVGAALASYHKSRPLSHVSEAGYSGNQLDAEASVDGQVPQRHGREPAISYPPNAYVDGLMRNSISHPCMCSDDSTRSSWESSSVIRQYWAASMTARAERRLEGYPPSTSYLDDEGSIFGDRRHRRTPSQSSQSRKADIFGADDSSIESDFTDGLISSNAGKDGVAKRYYQSTINSVQSYLRRSMSMSLTSLRSGMSTTDDESIYDHGRGFRSSINNEYLHHLNIKSLYNEQRQLDYYRHFYRRNPTITTMGTVDKSSRNNTRTMTITTSQRTSSAPSLTSTNDPFQTFDSNDPSRIFNSSEVQLAQDPFSDCYVVENDETQSKRLISPSLLTQTVLAVKSDDS